MRVLLVVGPATGGIGAHAADLARRLAREHELLVATAPVTAERFDWAVPVRAVWPSGGGRLRRWRELRALARSADLVHAHGHQAGLLSLLAAGRRTPVVVSWHNAVLVGGARGRLLALAERVQARRAALVTGASADLVARARALGAREPQLAPVAAPRAGEPVPDGARERVRGALGLPAGAPLVLTVSRLAPQKRLDVLLEAARLLGPEVTWLLVGDGDPGVAARLRAGSEGTGVRLLGARDDVPELLAAADVFALTSDWEARALVVQEAMAAGVPVVATEVGGLPELLEGVGLLVRPGDPRAVAEAVSQLLEAPSRRAALAEAARRRAATFPTAEQVAQAWQVRYARVARVRPPLG